MFFFKFLIKCWASHLRDLTAWQKVSIQKWGKREQNPNLLKQHRTLTLIVLLWRAEGARFLCVYCGGLFSWRSFARFCWRVWNQICGEKECRRRLVGVKQRRGEGEGSTLAGWRKNNMIYDVNSALFRSFLSQKGAGDKRKMEEQKPSSQKPKANENKPVMNE